MFFVILSEILFILFISLDPSFKQKFLNLIFSQFQLQKTSRLSYIILDFCMRRKTKTKIKIEILSFWVFQVEQIIARGWGVRGQTVFRVWVKLRKKQISLFFIFHFFFILTSFISIIGKSLYRCLMQFAIHNQNKIVINYILMIIIIFTKIPLVL